MKQMFFALLFVVVPGASAAQADSRIVKPEIRVGDSWTYRSTNLLGPGEAVHETRVSFVDDKVILAVSTRKSDGKEFDSSWTTEWNAVTSYTGRMFRPRTGLFRFPLRAGDRHELKMEWLEPRTTGTQGVATGSARVVGWETVEVPAGRFRAMKVETEFAVRAPGGHNPHFKGAFWYVPEVRRWVKSQVDGPRSTTSEELLAYKLNED